MRRLSSLLVLTALLLLALPGFARSRCSLTPAQRAQVRQQVRAEAQWHFALYEGRRPSLKTVIRPVPHVRDQFTASAEISAIWRGARATLASNQFTITRRADGKLTVASQHPFLPR